MQDTTGSTNKASDAPDHGPFPWWDRETLRIEYVQKGKTTRELAEEWDCSPDTVSRWVRKHGLSKGASA